MKKVRLSRAGVKQYEKMAGFKTTGKVTIYMSSDEDWDAYTRLMLPEPLCPDDKKPFPE